VIIVWAYWATRLWNLTALPIFLDEGIYIRRELMVNAGNWLVEISDGTVLLPRILAPLLARAGPSVESMLFVARWFNVALDMFALVFLYVLVRDAFSHRAALLAALIYLFNPFVFFYDRIALADGPLMTFYIIAFWLAFRVLRNGRPWREAFLLGLVIGLACLTKSSGILAGVVPVLVVLTARDWRLALRRWPWWSLAFVIAGAIFLPFLAAGAGQFQLSTRSAFSSNLQETLNLAGANGMMLLEWMTAYWPGLLGLSIALAVSASIFLGRTGLVWSAGALLPILFFVVIARSWYPRYILLSMAPLMILWGWWFDNGAGILDRLSARWSTPLLAALLIVILAPSIQFDYAIAANPPDAPWPAIERWQYIENWPAGYGVQDAAALLMQAAAEADAGINVVRMNMNGPMLEVMDLYLRANGRISRFTLNLKQDSTSERLTGMARDKPTYIILDPPREGMDFGLRYPQVRLRGNFSKPGDHSSILVYEW
jgi:hypothetical protein